MIEQRIQLLVSLKSNENLSFLNGLMLKTSNKIREMTFDRNRNEIKMQTLKTDVKSNNKIQYLERIYNVCLIHRESYYH